MNTQTTAVKSKAELCWTSANVYRKYFARETLAAHAVDQQR